MQWMILPTAAWLDAVIVIVAILLTVGGWIFNAIQKFNEKAEEIKARREKTMRQQRKEMHIGQVHEDQDHLREISPGSQKGQAMTPRQRLEMLAAQRREQMRAQAAGGNVELASQPDNLTAAQKAARDRARAAYQRRAEQLARQRQAKQQAVQAKQQARAARASASRGASAGASSGGVSGGTFGGASGGARAAAQAQAARDAQVAQQRARQQAQRQAASAMEARQQAARQQQPSLSTAAAPMEVQRLEGVQTIHESTGAAKPASASRGIDGPALKGALTGRSIRAAFVLKEVLDRPIGLRDPQDQPGMNIY